MMKWVKKGQRTEDGEASRWHFCGEDGVLGDELEFQMRAGQCIAGGRLTADDYCNHGYDTLVGMTAIILLSGVSLPSELVGSQEYLGGSSPLQMLPSRDTSFLEAELSRMFFDSHPVTVTAVSVPEGSQDSLLVTLYAEVITEEHGLDGAIAGDINTLLHNMKYSMSNSFSSGAFVGMLENDLNALPAAAVGDDLFRGSTSLSASLHSLEVQSVKFIDHGSYNLDVTDTTPESGVASQVSSSTEQSSMYLDVMGEYTLVIVVAFVAAGTAFLLYTKFYEPYADNRDGRGSHTQLPDRSSHTMELNPLPTRVMSAEEEDPSMDADATHNTAALFTWNKI